MQANMRSNGLLVSVVIPCYNQGEFLADAIDSVLRQTYSPVEVIVINDGSTDHTALIAAQYGDRIRCLFKPNAGLPAARNTGILYAKGEFVHFLDADDFLAPDMLQLQMAAARRTPHADVLHSGWQEVDAQGKRGLCYPVPCLASDPFHLLLANNLGPPCCVTVRRAAFANTGMFDIAMTSCEDWDMWLRLAAQGSTFAAVPEARAFYRKHSQSMSTHYERMWRMSCVVQQKARSHHSRCAACRNAVLSSRASHRHAYFATLVSRDILSRYRQGKFGAGTLRLCRAVLCHPALLSFLCVHAVIRLCARVSKQRAGLRASSVSQTRDGRIL